MWHMRRQYFLAAKKIEIQIHFEKAMAEKSIYIGVLFSFGECHPQVLLYIFTSSKNSVLCLNDSIQQRSRM